MELQYDPAGRTLLKVCGVIMLIFGVLGILIYLLGLGAVIVLNYATGGIFSASNDLLGMGLLLAAAIAELIAGSLGVRAAKKPERAGKGLVFWSLLCLLLTLAGMIHIALRTATAPWWELAFGTLLGAVIPIVCLIAVSRVRKGPVFEGEASVPERTSEEESEQTPETEE